MADGVSFFSFEKAMRITVHLEATARNVPSPYAVLWLDCRARSWLREGYVGFDQFDLPQWGSLIVQSRETVLCGPHDVVPYFVIEGLQLDHPERDREGIYGVAQWCGSGQSPPLSGHWQLEQNEFDASRHPRTHAKTQLTPRSRSHAL